MIDVSKANCALFESPDEATEAVKLFNAAQGGEEFQKAVERSRERVLSLVPDKRLGPNDISGEESMQFPSGKGKRLMMLLEKEASEKPCSLGRLEELCIDYQLDWDWVESQLTKLSNWGSVIFPRPWSIQLVSEHKKKRSKLSEEQDVSGAIVELLRELGGSADYDSIVGHFLTLGVAESAVEASLNKLAKTHQVYQPNPGIMSLLPDELD
ncbi:MAG: hypothetical protein JSW61_04975 [Candidatus Thorarchaeota archaeon]|nr:MAG: hypothetical protein JSW61_04975 [Candidatus Thorarchaeota archaeon]